MTQQPTPTAVHPDTIHVSDISRDGPASDFTALLEREGATPELLASIRENW